MVPCLTTWLRLPFKYTAHRLCIFLSGEFPTPPFWENPNPFNTKDRSETQWLVNYLLQYSYLNARAAEVSIAFDVTADTLKATERGSGLTVISDRNGTGSVILK